MRILVIEDETTLAAQLQQALERAGYVVQVTHDGREGHYLGEVESFDAVVLDLGLPGMDGVSILRRWRAAGVAMPVLILTARNDWHDKVEGMDAGADDYVAKPFHMEEVLARMRALLRRAAGQAHPRLQLGGLELDPRASTVSCDGIGLVLTSHEYRLLAFMMHHPGQVLSRTQLTEHIYAQDFERDSNTIEVFIVRLRKKLPPGYIETVRGMGYRLVDPAA
ncbi:response regulator transcription factor [Alcaligenes sp. SDU_A2]|uniref:response regulator transcription factor n=1 Tax=Alcaligenes sp. SDU_A2 TaxID=3136634 RepID=UPI00311EB0C3